MCFFCVSFFKAHFKNNSKTKNPCASCVNSKVLLWDTYFLCCCTNSFYACDVSKFYGRLRNKAVPISEDIKDSDSRVSGNEIVIIKV